MKLRQTVVERVDAMFDRLRNRGGCSPWLIDRLHHGIDATVPGVGFRSV